jgi:hypothetical protein
MATLVTIQTTDIVSQRRSTLNSNFAALNTAKLEAPDGAVAQPVTIQPTTNVASLTLLRNTPFNDNGDITSGVPVLNINGANPSASNGSLINIETSRSQKVVFWGDAAYGYTILEFHPERRTGSNAGDVYILTHRLNGDDGVNHQHLSIYTSRSTGQPLKRFNLGYAVDISEFDIENAALSIDDPTKSFVGTQMPNGYIVEIRNSSTALTNVTKGILDVSDNNSSSTQKLARFIGLGSGTNILVDNRGSGKAVHIDHDDTGSNPSLHIDRDGNNASKIWALKVDTDNAGAGGVGGLDLSSFSTGEAAFKFVADANDPTAGGGAAAGRIAIDIGGAIKYFAYY